jgi:hypothetical protein
MTFFWGIFTVLALLSAGSFWLGFRPWAAEWSSDALTSLGWVFAIFAVGALVVMGIFKLMERM